MKFQTTTNEFNTDFVRICLGSFLCKWDFMFSWWQGWRWLVVFWDVATYRLVDIDWRFREVNCFLHQGGSNLQLTIKRLLHRWANSCYVSLYWLPHLGSLSITSDKTQALSFIKALTLATAWNRLTVMGTVMYLFNWDLWLW